MIWNEHCEFNGWSKSDVSPDEDVYIDQISWL